MKKISWFKLIWDCNNICNKIIRSQNTFDCVLGISRGGNILATILSYKLKLPLSIVSVQSYDGKNKGRVNIDRNIINFKTIKSSKKILLVDDLIDSGDTINSLFRYFKDKELCIATLYTKKKKYTPLYYIKKMDKDTWIQFPYE